MLSLSGYYIHIDKGKFLEIDPIALQRRVINIAKMDTNTFRAVQ